MVFAEMPKGFPPAQDHDHSIHLQQGNVTPNIRPFKYPYDSDGYWWPPTCFKFQLAHLDSFQFNTFICNGEIYL
jgi:hypothetical protein